MKTSSQRGRQFFQANQYHNLAQVFSGLSSSQRKQRSEDLHAFQKIMFNSSPEIVRQIYQFVSTFDNCNREIDRLQRKSKEDEVKSKWTQQRQRKSKLPLNRIKLPEPKYRPEYRKSSRSRSLSRQSSNQNKPKIFDCLVRLCPLFGRKRGSNPRMNPRKTSKAKSSSKNKTPTTTKNSRLSKAFSKDKSISPLKDIKSAPKVNQIEQLEGLEERSEKQATQSYEESLDVDQEELSDEESSFLPGLSGL